MSDCILISSILIVIPLLILLISMDISNRQFRKTIKSLSFEVEKIESKEDKLWL